MKLRKEFKNFLKENDAYCSFIVNMTKSFLKHPNSEEDINIIHWFFKLEDDLTISADGLIDKAFDWEPTKEGFDYWCDIEQAWVNKLTELVGWV